MKQYDFDARQTLARAVESFTLESWLAYYRQVFLQQQHSLQVIAPGRWDKLPESDARRYESATEIKRGHATYQVN